VSIRPVALHKLNAWRVFIISGPIRRRSSARFSLFATCGRRTHTRETSYVEPTKPARGVHRGEGRLRRRETCCGRGEPPSPLERARGSWRALRARRLRAFRRLPRQTPNLNNARV
jgi:hypothetical protein